MIVGYQISGRDNDSYMLGEETRKAETPEEYEFYDWRFTFNGGQHPATCTKCGRKIDPNFVDPNFKLRKKRLDISTTYDGYTIVSERFKNFCMNENIDGIEFIKLPSQPGFYWFRLNRILVVDQEKSLELEFMYYCDVCNSYAGIFGASNLKFKNVSELIPEGIYRTDLEFAQAHEQSPMIISSVELGNLIKAQNFKGICINSLAV